VSEPTAPKTSFWSELQRRHVYKVGVMYAVAGWLVVQVITQVFPIYEISTRLQRIFVGVIVAGFPGALILAWLFDLTPTGIVRTDALPADGETTATQQDRRSTDRKLNYVLGILLALGLGYFLIERFGTGSAKLDAASLALDKSIAVLPFENLSEDKANAFFASGIQDEILTRLAKIGALKVISRTSTAHYASSPDNLPDIARQLGVAHILEGSVQRAGDAVHINVQLIRAATDDHLWAESYDRKLDNIFGVEGEVAGAIAEQLNAKLTGAEHAAVTQRPTDNLAAYEAYLRARAINNEGYDFATSRRVAEAYAEAVRLDPNFALAWAGLAAMSGYLYFNGVDTDRYTPAAIKLASDNAIRLQPGLSEAQRAEGLYRYRVLRDFAGAESLFTAVTLKSPNDKEAWQALGFVERREGKWASGMVHLERAAQLDPLDAGLMVVIGGETLQNLRRFDEAHAWLDRSLALAPRNPLALVYKASIYQAQGRLVDAARLLDSIPTEVLDTGLVLALGQQRLYERRFTDAIVELKPLLTRPEDSLDGLGPQIGVMLGFAQRFSGQTSAARSTFEQVIKKLKLAGAEQVDESLGPITLAFAYAGAGQPQAALLEAQRAVDLYRNDAIHLPQAEIALAQLQTLVGDRDAAIAALPHLLEVLGGLTPALLRVDPFWDSLRDDPRFQKLIVDGEAAMSRSSQPGHD